MITGKHHWHWKISVLNHATTGKCYIITYIVYITVTEPQDLIPLKDLLFLEELSVLTMQMLLQ